MKDVKSRFAYHLNYVFLKKKTILGQFLCNYTLTTFEQRINIAKTFNIVGNSVFYFFRIASPSLSSSYLVYVSFLQILSLTTSKIFRKYKRMKNGKMLLKSTRVVPLITFSGNNKNIKLNKHYINCFLVKTVKVHI